MTRRHVCRRHFAFSACDRVYTNYEKEHFSPKCSKREFFSIPYYSSL